MGVCATCKHAGKKKKNVFFEDPSSVAQERSTEAVPCPEFEEVISYHVHTLALDRHGYLESQSQGYSYM